MKTLALTGLQQAFHDHLLNMTSSIVQEVVDSGGISVDHRLNIYHNAYRVRLLENLQDAYEKTFAYLGDATFQATALAFIEAHPPQHRNLRWHGAAFPQWLNMQFPADEDIAELAMIDWQLRHAFDGPNATPIKAGELSGLSTTDWESVRFQFAPTLFLTPLRFNSVAIWHTLDQEQVPPKAELLADESWLLIWRKGWQPHFRIIQKIEHSILFKMQQGMPFAEVCSALHQQLSETEALTVAAESLHTWLQDELLVGITVGARWT